MVFFYPKYFWIIMFLVILFFSDPPDGRMGTASIRKILGHILQIFSLFVSVYCFAGSIPTEIGLLTKLEYMDLERNKLTGT